MKKHLKWIIPLCVVLLAAAGGLTAFLLTRSREQQPAPKDIEIYQNINAAQYRGKNTEVPVRQKNEEDGYFYIMFAANGEQQRLPVTQDVIDRGIDMHDLVGLVLDENGVVTDFYSIEDCTGGYLAENCFVTSIEGNTVTCNSTAKYDGYNVTFEMTEDLQVYIDDGDSPLSGMPTEITVDCEITAIKDENGKVFLAYVMPLAETPDVYWNVSRKYDSTTKMTTREPDALGFYVYEMAMRGQIVTVKTRDMKVASTMDSFAAKNMVLTFDEEGLVTGAQDGSKGTGGWVASWCDTTYLNGREMEFTRTIGGSNQGTVYPCVKANDFVAYNVSNDGVMGEVTELRMGDRVHCLTNKRGQVCIAFVVSRIVDSPLYWNVERRYNSTEKQTTRHVKADGYYHILVAAEGKQMTVRVKDRSLVNAMDNKAAKHFGLKLNGDIVEKVYTADQCTGGTYFASWYDVVKIENGVVYTARTFDPGFGKSASCKMAEDCRIYNVSSAANMVGEVTDLRVGDRIHGQTNQKGEIEVIFVVGNRTRTGTALYWNVKRMYNSSTKESTRQPDADGWYNILMVCNGQQLTVKTKDAAIVKKIDAAADRIVGMKVNADNEITYFCSSKNEVTGGSYFASWYDVTKIEGDYVTAERMFDPGLGKVAKAKMQKDCKVYNVSESYENFMGEETELRVGDRIQGHCNIYGGLSVIFVVARPDVPGEPDHFHCACNGDHVGVGDHVCNNETGWSAWTSNRRLPSSGNWYLTTDVQLESLVTVPVGSELNLCLNGHTVTGYKGSSNMFGVNTGFTITDCSAEENWGSLIGQNDAYGSVMYVYENKAPATVNLFAGHIKSNYAEPKTKDGGIIYIGSNGSNKAVFNMYGGTITGIDAGEKIGGVVMLIHGNTFNLYGGTIYGGNAKYGGAFYIKNGTLNVRGGVIEGGTAYSGGAVYVSKGVVNVYDGAVRNGYATFDGGNIYMEKGENTVNIYGGTVSGGAAANEGGNFRTNAQTVINVLGGSVEGGGVKDGATVTKKGGNIQCFGLLNIDGGTVKNGKAKNAGGNISTWGSSCKVILASGLVENGSAGSGPNIYISNAATSARVKLEISGGTVRKGGTVHLDHAEAIMTGGTVADGFNVTKASTLTLSGAPVIAGRHDFNLKVLNTDSIIVNDLTDGAKICITGANNGGALGMLADPADKIYFHSDNNTVDVYVDGENKLYLVGKHSHCVCGSHYDDHTCSTVTWSEWTDPNSLPTSGSWYLSTDVTTKATVTVPEGSTLQLCLNGYTITNNNSTSGSVFGVHTGLTITDCSAEKKWGSVIGKNDAYGTIMYIYENRSDTTVNLFAGHYKTSLTAAKTTDGGLIYIGSNAKYDAVLNIYGGTYTGTNVGTKSGGVITLIHKNVVNIYGGTIYGGTAKNGGAIYIGDGTLNMYGGEITGGHATFDGGNINLKSGTVNIYDGTISNGTADNEGGNIRDWSKTTINMYGGTIKDGSANGGGNLMLVSAFNMYGGTLKDGTAKNFGGNISTWSSPRITLAKHSQSATVPTISGGTGKNGGSICLRGTAPSLNISYGMISDGTATNGKCVHVLSGTVEVSGTAQISVLNLAGGALKAGTLEEGAQIGITMATPGVFLTGCSDLTPYFNSINTAYEAVYNGTDMLLQKK